MTRLRSPVLMTLGLAPFLGESMSGATPPLDLLLPWNLALFVALYGCGALLCREIVVRRGLGLPGVLWLGAAYGVYEEALVDRFWFSSSAWHDLGVGDYGEIWRTNALIATHLTVFHVAVSVGATIVLTHHAFPDRRHEPWVGPVGLGLAAVALLIALPLYGQLGKGPLAQQGVALGLCLVLLWRAFHAPWTTREHLSRAAGRLGPIAFTATLAHFTLVYATPSIGLPWPMGLALTLVPVSVGVLLARRSGAWHLDGPDILRVTVGVLSFFVALQALVGLAGRYDLTLGALILGIALRRVRPAPSKVARDHAASAP